MIWKKTGFSSCCFMGWEVKRDIQFYTCFFRSCWSISKEYLNFEIEFGAEGKHGSGSGLLSWLKPMLQRLVLFYFFQSLYKASCDTQLQTVLSLFRVWLWEEAETEGSTNGYSSPKAQGLLKRWRPEDSLSELLTWTHEPKMPRELKMKTLISLSQERWSKQRGSEATKLLKSTTGKIVTVGLILLLTVWMISFLQHS